VTSIVVGLFAALSWGVHDLLVRYLGGRMFISTAVLTVLCVGTLATLPFALAGGGWGEMTGSAVAVALAGGGFYALACLALYRALAIGPVKLVAPIIAAYPILSVSLAWLAGNPVAAKDWLGVSIIVAGVGLVAWLSDPEDRHLRRRAAIVFATVSGAGFAFAFALAQAAVRAGAEWPAVLTGRLAAIALVLAIVLVVARAPLVPPRAQAGWLGAMGVLDALALSLVTLAGSLPNPEFAAVTTSIFGVITVVLARVLLHERMTPGQWGSVAVVFSGVALLGI
jgi:drug/metabolite transporter (DMT)-like permease